MFVIINKMSNVCRANILINAVFERRTDPPRKPILFKYGPTPSGGAFDVHHVNPEQALIAACESAGDGDLPPFIDVADHRIDKIEFAGTVE